MACDLCTVKAKVQPVTAHIGELLVLSVRLCPAHRAPLLAWIEQLTRSMLGTVEPRAEEWAVAAWSVQSWIRSSFDGAGRCALCGTSDPSRHVNGCPWPQTRALLDRTAYRP